MHAQNKPLQRLRHTRIIIITAHNSIGRRLTRVICVQRGLLLNGDNSLFEEVIAAVGHDSEWSQLCRTVYAAEPEPTTLRQQITAGLQLYNLTAVMLAEILLPEDQPLISATTALINHALSEGSHQE